MTTLAIANNWEDWTQEIDGNGVITTSLDNKLVTLSADNTSRAFLRKRINVSAGEKITVSVMAEASAGEVQISIDYPAVGSSKSKVTAIDNDIKKYTCEFAVPFDHDPSTDYMQVSIGSFSTTAGTGKVSTPIIDSTNSPVGFLRVYTLGLIKLSKSGGVLTPSINQGFALAGINSLSYDNVNKRLQISTQKMPAVTGLKPIFDVGMTIDQLPQIQAKIGQYDPSTGQVSVKFVDNTGVFVDLESVMSDGALAYCWVRGVGI